MCIAQNQGARRPICGDWKSLIRQSIDIQGTIKFTDDTDYWQANSFPFVFQNVTSFFKLGGDDVFIYGGRSWLFFNTPPQCFSQQHPSLANQSLGDFAGIGVPFEEHKTASAVTMTSQRQAVYWLPRERVRV